MESNDYPLIRNSTAVQVMPLGDKSLAIINDIYPDYPRFDKEARCSWHFIICDDAAANCDSLNELLPGNGKGYAPRDFIFDLASPSPLLAESLKRKWRYYEVLAGNVEDQRRTLRCFLRLFERHIVSHDHLFNYDSESLHEFLLDGIFLNSAVINGIITDDNVQAEIIKSITQDVSDLTIAFCQPAIIDGNRVTIPDDIMKSIMEIDHRIEVYDNIRKKEQKWLYSKMSFIECINGKPETMVLSLKRITDI